MVSGTEGDGTCIGRCLVGLAEVPLGVSGKDRKRGGILTEESDIPSSLGKIPVRDTGIVLNDDGGGSQQKVPGLGKLTAMEEVGGRLEVGRPIALGAEPGEESAALLAVGEVGLEVV